MATVDYLCGHKALEWEWGWGRLILMLEKPGLCAIPQQDDHSPLSQKRRLRGEGRPQCESNLHSPVTFLVRSLGSFSCVGRDIGHLSPGKKEREGNVFMKHLYDL